MQNATHSFRSEKVHHHCVQRVSKPRKTFLVWLKKKFWVGFLNFLGGILSKKDFLDCF
jgi:hypothetical protein